jgi:hypothetical protein
MRAACLVLLTAVFPLAASPQSTPAAPQPAAPVIVVDFSHPGANPSQWTLTLHQDGSGHFHLENADPPPGSSSDSGSPGVDRDIQVSQSFAGRFFTAAQRHNWFNQQCESHFKVALQGEKTFTYRGPEGQGSCTFNYSKDKEIQSLSDAVLGLEETLREGARLQMLLQHDPLGLDREMEYLADAAKDGRVRQIPAIRAILQQLADDPAVLDRVRKRAHDLLLHPGIQSER